jgi:hypothetical protein
VLCTLSLLATLTSDHGYLDAPLSPLMPLCADRKAPSPLSALRMRDWGVAVGAGLGWAIAQALVAALFAAHSKDPYMVSKTDTGTRLLLYSVMTRLLIAALAG